MEHKCHHCGTSVSVFWYPFAFGVGRDDEGQPYGGEFFELCDHCMYDLVDLARKERGE